MYASELGLEKENISISKACLSDLSIITENKLFEMETHSLFFYSSYAQFGQ